MVSPTYKAGYDVGELTAAAPDGQSVAFESLGVFAGAPHGSNPGYFDIYLAKRTPSSGWQTAPIIAPATIAPFSESTDFSASLGLQFNETTLGPSDGAAVDEGTEAEFLMHHSEEPDNVGDWEPAGGLVLERIDGKEIIPLYRGASPDLCHIFLIEAPLKNTTVPPGALLADQQIYELSRGCDGESPSLRVVSLNNSGDVISSCRVDAGVENYTTPGHPQDKVNAIAADGQEVFFTVCPGGLANLHQLYVRLGDEKTLEVAMPPSEALSCDEQIPCPGGLTRASTDFAGSSEDGSKAFFTTEAPLVAGDKDTSSDLYMANIGCPASKANCAVAERQVTSMVQVSHAFQLGEAAEVQGGLVALSPDGSHAYFVARGVLSEGPNAEGREAVSGADNLYLYESATGKRVFIADLCSGPETSGGVEDTSCPAGPSTENEQGNDSRSWRKGGEAQVADEGRFLVFTSYGQLLVGDTDNARDVYRYDAQTGLLTRVSIGEAGADANGNQNDEGQSNADATISFDPPQSDFVISQQRLDNRAISEDGSSIVFKSAAPLSRAAVNGLENIYVWHESSISLLSSGTSEEPDKQVVISPSGRDIFFLTTSGLVPQDKDGLGDIYDARIGGGEPASPAPRQPCEGDGCQGPLTNPVPLLVPGSATQAPGENLPAPTKAPPKKKKSKKPAGKKGKRAKRALHRRSTLAAQRRGK